MVREAGTHSVSPIFPGLSPSPLCFKCVASAPVLLRDISRGFRLGQLWAARWLRGAGVAIGLGPTAWGGVLILDARGVRDSVGQAGRAFCEKNDPGILPKKRPRIPYF